MVAGSKEMQTSEPDQAQRSSEERKKQTALKSFVCCQRKLSKAINFKRRGVANEYSEFHTVLLQGKMCRCEVISKGGKDSPYLALHE